MRQRWLWKSFDSDCELTDFPPERVAEWDADFFLTFPDWKIRTPPMPMLPTAPTTTFRYRTSLMSTHHAHSPIFRHRIPRANLEAITRLSKMEPIPLRPAPMALRARRTTSHNKRWVIQCWAAECDFSRRPPLLRP